MLSNLDKVLYPEVGFTKGQVLDYYTRIAPVLLPAPRRPGADPQALPGRRRREVFFEKNAPRGTPEWVHTETLPSPGSSKERETIDYVVVDDLATLVWTANLAALELHTHIAVRRTAQPASGRPMVVFDLDPGPPATIVECCEVARPAARRCARPAGLRLAKTSGSKGLQLYARADGFSSSEETSAYAKGLAQRLEKSHPELVVHRMTKALRPGKVLVDWSQNSAAKTTVSVYSCARRAVRPCRRR